MAHSSIISSKMGKKCGSEKERSKKAKKVQKRLAKLIKKSIEASTLIVFVMLDWTCGSTYMCEILTNKCVLRFIL